MTLQHIVLFSFPRDLSAEEAAQMQGSLQSAICLLRIISVLRPAAAGPPFCVSFPNREAARWPHRRSRCSRALRSL